MRAELLKGARIKHHAGEIVEVSPAEFNFLQSIGAARPAPDKKKKQRKVEILKDILSKKLLN